MDSVALQADAKSGLESLKKLLQPGSYQTSLEYRERISQLQSEWNVEVDRLYQLTSEEGNVQTLIVGALNEFMAPEDVILCAAGSLPGDSHRLWRSVLPKSYHMEYGYSCMGYEVAGGLGIKMAKNSGDVFVMVGDGSYLMMNSEIVTAVQENEKLIIILINNHGFGSINGLSLSLGSKGFGNQYRKRDESSSEYTGDKLPVDYAAHAKSMGIDAITVKTKKRLEKAIAQARENSKSTLIEVLVDLDAKVPGYGAWWDVPVAEISESDKVTIIREEYNEKIKGERDF